MSLTIFIDQLPSEVNKANNGVVYSEFSVTEEDYLSCICVKDKQQSLEEMDNWSLILSSIAIFYTNDVIFKIILFSTRNIFIIFQHI